MNRPQHRPCLSPCPICGGHALRPLRRAAGRGPVLECCQHCRLVRLATPFAATGLASPGAAAPGLDAQVIWDGHAVVFSGPDNAPFARLSCHDVIGRAPDPGVLVAHLASALQTGGLIHITEPDFHHWRRPANLEGWAGFAPDQRSHWFAPRTLTRLLADHGLWLVRRRRRLSPLIDLVARKG